MIYVAFIFGFMGSLHCLGMCGPLAFSLMPGIRNEKFKGIWRATQYNLGRIVSYTLLGLVAGMFGGIFNFSGLQKPITIFLGITLIVLFLFSLDLEKLFSRTSWYKKFNHKIIHFISQNISGSLSKYTILLGMLNGLIPCGLVYLALAGAITEANILEGALFMMFFGLGTFPAMFLLLAGISFVKIRSRIPFNKILGFMHLILGIFLIYKSLSTDIPLDLSLILSLADPILCH